MCRHEIGTFIAALLAHQRGAQGERAPERNEEPRCAVRIITGCRDGLDPHPVGVEFLLAREAGDGELAIGLHLLAFFAALDDRGGAADDRIILFEFGALGGVTRRHMGDFMGHHGGDFG